MLCICDLHVVNRNWFGWMSSDDWVRIINIFSEFFRQRDPLHPLRQSTSCRIPAPRRGAWRKLGAPGAILAKLKKIIRTHSGQCHRHPNSFIRTSYRYPYTSALDFINFECGYALLDTEHEPTRSWYPLPSVLQCITRFMITHYWTTVLPTYIHGYIHADFIIFDLCIFIIIIIITTLRVEPDGREPKKDKYATKSWG